MKKAKPEMIRNTNFYSPAAKDKMKLKNAKSPQFEATGREQKDFLDMLSKSNNETICVSIFDGLQIIFI